MWHFVYGAPGKSQGDFNQDGFVKRPTSALRFTGKMLNVPKVRLALSRLARLAKFIRLVTLFTKPSGNITFYV